MSTVELQIFYCTEKSRLQNVFAWEFQIIPILPFHFYAERIMQPELSNSPQEQYTVVERYWCYWSLKTVQSS